MSNMDFMDKPIDSIFSDSEIKMDELSHHGVLGMSWGERNGPPYPLSGVDKKVARAEAKRKKIQEKRIAKLQKAAKKARKAKVKAAKRQAKTLEKQEKLLDKKAKLLEEDNYKKIMKNRKLFTNEELKYIQDRRNQQINDKIDRFMNRAAKITTAANSIMNVTVGINQIRALNKQLKLDDIELKKSNLSLTEQAERMARDTKKFEYELESKRQNALKDKETARMQKAIADTNRQKAIQERNKTIASFYEQSAKIADEAKKNYENRRALDNMVNDDFFDRAISRRVNTIGSGANTQITSTTYTSPASFTLDRRTTAGRRNAAWANYLVSDITPNQNGNIYDLVGKDVRATLITDLDRANR